MAPARVRRASVVCDTGFPPDETKVCARQNHLEGRHRRRRLSQIVAEVLVLGALIAFGWFEHTTVTRSVGVVGRAQWGWLLAAAGFELLSMMAFARTQRIVLRAAGVRASVLSMAATALAGNAISVSLPLVVQEQAASLATVDFVMWPPTRRQLAGRCLSLG